jgi:hypothetical protein
MTAAPPRYRRPAALRGRAVLWLFALLFLFQMLGATHHDHEVAAKSQHCVSCALHAQPHAAPPDMAVHPAPVGWMLLHPVLTVDRVAPAAQAARWLLPLPHAPPAFPHRQ